MDPQPGLPVNPSAVDIARYNAWADRNGRPRFGAAAAAPAAPAPAAPAPKRRGRPGLPLPARPSHGVFPENAEGGGWIRPSFWRNRSEYAFKVNRQNPLKLRTFNSRTGEDKWTANGRDYYDHNRQKFIINVPCLGYVPFFKTRKGGIEAAALNPNHPANAPDAQGDADDDPLLRSTYYGNGHSERVVPLTPEGIAGFNSPTNTVRVLNLGIVRDQDHSQADIEAALRREVPRLLQQAPRVNTVDGMKHKIAIDSTIVWVWDETKEITFDEQIFRHLHGDDQPLIETLLDRPLLGLPYIDEKMYGRQGLAKIACMDLTDRGGCVVAQIVETVKKTEKVAQPGSRKGGKDTRIRQQVPRFTPVQVAAEFDIIFGELIPGEAVDEDDFEVGYVEAQRPQPYQFAGWRDVGITTKMVSSFCDRNKIGLRVLYKNAVIFKNDVDTRAGGHDKSVIVYHICDDHAYFYDDQFVKHGASQLRQGPCKIMVKAEALVRLRTRADEDDAMPFVDMEEFRLDAFLEQVESKISKTYYCYQREVKDVKQLIDAAKVPIWVGLGARPELIRSLNVCHKTKKAENDTKRKASEKKIQIRVRVVPDDALCLQDASVAFSELTDLKLIYNGESKSMATFRQLNSLCVSRRLKIPDDVRESIKQKQGCACALCREKLGPKFEVDHISPLCQNGTNDIKNLRALCQPCHSEETDKLILAGLAMNDTSKFHTIESHMSPKLLRDLHNAPKPKEVSYGIFKETKQIQSKLAPKKPTQEKAEELAKKTKRFQITFRGVKKTAPKTKHIMDALLKHESAEIVSTAPVPVLPSHISQLKCFDAKGCRLNALVKRTRGLPVFSALDEWESFSLAVLKDLDFVYITIEGRWHDALFPYTGSRWYAAEVCEYLLERNIVKVENCKAGLRATRHVPSEVLQKHLQTIAEVYDQVAFPSEQWRNTYVKGAILAMIGLWNCTSQHSYKQFRGFYEIDAGAGVKQRRRMEDGSFIFTSSTELVGLYSMAPWGRIALDVEQLRVAQAISTIQ